MKQIVLIMGVMLLIAVAVGPGVAQESSPLIGRLISRRVVITM